ncbi:MAG: hypothetical protein A3I44_04790 [Candidatus Sungbacteria bacterium RIFCSPLOWO2_02_FULL_51_17]|uniref:Transcription regulator TrmB N-terminal domain-containing protein n=1 Tax=Candidatus Sungbacteria bacterium RIFCSPHIGHO2_02_FULL_51_29 TaxID=1802273 RepID=A0A1G2KRY7_9BACT|nr:MAG: hypothetical protein A2676_01580 [Candidatus Sungbacteria bacterium RIFCSPHIGHO2_01_FULL_51_22]OHA01241.1 MAG: hypothetical protein A3C16_02830 [Candidatus Sungbacteria bacterium RIFCSPHIGHO2_02_FULL_51_29]OHA05862.1 MAG: hypothetical protein A3B29_01840 [Candidatus Sungbacteria bacterium RIFCSPLOWO2_01_FULL_51_34]OHA11350.1 MAG: hypothetical protein A3I44_04790 [Candidatus Sungbacteria bacterium RIFCSPLOWO2_02_FULL_51_17]
MLEAQFQKIGLNDNEREVYLAILRAGKITHERVSRATGVNRTTVYSIAEKLKKLGLISEDLGAKVSYLSSEGAEALSRMFEKEEGRLHEQKKTAEEIARELQHMTKGENYSVPKIKFVEEDDLNGYLYKRYGAWVQSGANYDSTWWGFEDHSFTEKYGTFIDWCWKQEPGNLQVRFFTNQADVEKEMSKKYRNRFIKPLAEENSFDSCFWVCGDYIIMVRSRERPHYLVEIYDTVLARNQRQLFKSLWDASK